MVTTFRATGQSLMVWSICNVKYWHRASNFDVGRQFDGFWRPASIFDVPCQYLTSGIKYLMCNIKYLTSNIKYLTSNIKYWRQIWRRTSKIDVGRQIFDLGRQKLMLDVKNRQIDVQHQIFTSKVNIWCFRCFTPLRLRLESHNFRYWDWYQKVSRYWDWYWDFYYTRQWNFNWDSYWDFAIWKIDIETETET